MDVATAVWIDRRWLEKRVACEPQIDLFDEVFPSGCELSRANLMAAGRAGLDLDWLAREILSRRAFRGYWEATSAARRTCREATAATFRAYEEAIATAQQAYYEATAPAWCAYREAEAAAWRTREEATAPALRAYREAAALALADALGLD